MRSYVDGVCAGSSSSFDDDALHSGEPDVFVGGDCPNEGGEFASYGDIDDVGGFAGSDEPAMPAHSRTWAFQAMLRCRAHSRTWAFQAMSLTGCGRLSLRARIWVPIRAGRR
ncbi:MAG: hypothetical protein DLM68_14490 [Hyphomicrobiales bacterium]|nr:MAG: hypothetical protein DLM68_14490 [Hyphomicrobiales bacterium]